MSREQLRRLGLSDDAIDRRIASHLLRPEHRGVYAFGAAGDTREGRWQAALLAGGEGSRLSRRSSARLWEIRGVEERLDVIVARSVGAHERFTVHRPTILDPIDLAEHRGFPTTTVAKTLVDLAAVIRSDALARALRQSVSRELFDLRAVTETLIRHRGWRGTRTLRGLLSAHHDWNVDLRQRLEQRFRRFVLERALDRPLHNVTVEGWMCDVVWPGAKLIVELDSRKHHLNDPKAFEDDRRRDADLVAVGWRVIRITWRRLHDDPVGVERVLRTLLEG